MNKILKKCPQLMAIRLSLGSMEPLMQKYQNFNAEKASKMKFHVIKMPRKIKWIYVDFLELNLVFDLSDCENIFGLYVPTS